MGLWLLLAGLNGAMAVGFAAYASHGAAGEAIGWVERASQFQLLHAIALLALARPCAEGLRLLRPAAWAMVAGIVLFSGSLYLKALGIALPVPMATPLGGLCLIGSWLLLALGGGLAANHAGKTG